MTGFTDTTDDLDWLEDDDGKKLEAFCAECARDGFTPIPDDHAPGEGDGCEYRIHGPLCYYRWTT